MRSENKVIPQKNNDATMSEDSKETGMTVKEEAGIDNLPEDENGQESIFMGKNLEEIASGSFPSHVFQMSGKPLTMASLYTVADKVYEALESEFKQEHIVTDFCLLTDNPTSVNHDTDCSFGDLQSCFLYEGEEDKQGFTELNTYPIGKGSHVTFKVNESAKVHVSSVEVDGALELMKMFPADVKWFDRFYAVYHLTKGEHLKKSWKSAVGGAGLGYFASFSPSMAVGAVIAGLLKRGIDLSLQKFHYNAVDCEFIVPAGVDRGFRPEYRNRLDGIRRSIESIDITGFSFPYQRDSKAARELREYGIKKAEAAKIE